jgi:hypothetical protein
MRRGRPLRRQAASSRDVVESTGVAAATPRGVFCRASSREQPARMEFEAAGA